MAPIRLAHTEWKAYSTTKSPFFVLCLFQNLWLPQFFPLFLIYKATAFIKFYSFMKTSIRRLHFTSHCVVLYTGWNKPCPASRSMTKATCSMYVCVHTTDLWVHTEGWVYMRPMNHLYFEDGDLVVEYAFHSVWARRIGATRDRFSFYVCFKICGFHSSFPCFSFIKPRPS